MKLSQKLARISCEADNASHHAVDPEQKRLLRQAAERAMEALTSASEAEYLATCAKYQR